MSFVKYSKIAIILLFIVFNILTEPSKTISNQDSEIIRERVEIRDPNGKTITNFSTENRDLFLRFADCIAKEYKMPMYTTNLNDGVAIQFGARPTEDNVNNKEGLDKEIILTVSNGNIKRMFRFNESEINRGKAFKIWNLMGFRTGLSTGGDKWYVSRRTYVSPESPVEQFGEVVHRFISASINKDTEILKELFSDKVYFVKKDSTDSFDCITGEQAAKRFIEEYPANKIYILGWSLGTEGQLIVKLAADNENPQDAKWCISLYAVKEKDKYLFKHLHKYRDIWLPGEMVEKDN